MIDWSKLLAPFVASLVTGGGVWLLTSGKRAARNLGKTGTEIAMQELEDALREQAEARKTPGLEDDKISDEHVRQAKASLKGKKYLAAFLSALAEEKPAE